MQKRFLINMARTCEHQGSAENANEKHTFIYIQKQRIEIQETHTEEFNIHNIQKARRQSKKSSN